MVLQFEINLPLNLTMDTWQISFSEIVSEQDKIIHEFKLMIVYIFYSKVVFWVTLLIYQRVSEHLLNFSGRLEYLWRWHNSLPVIAIAQSGFKLYPSYLPWVNKMLTDQNDTEPDLQEVSFKLWNLPWKHLQFQCWSVNLSVK